MSETHRHKKNLTISLHPRDCFQLDFFYINEISSENDGIEYIFSAIDTFTKRAFCVPHEKCNALASIKSLKIIFNGLNVRPKSVVCDSGKEFKNNLFKEYLNKMGVKLVFSKSNQKASTVERFQKTIQRKIYMYITEFESLRFIHQLEKIVKNYNMTIHSFLGASPLEVECSKKLQFKVMVLHGEKYSKIKKRKPTFVPGDIVRLALKKTSFHRSYNLQKTYEHLFIHKVNTKLKFPRYQIKDQNLNLIDGDCLGYELIKIDLDSYRANILKTRIRRGVKQFLHSFKGYDSNFNLWMTLEESNPKYF